jgi:hypothetical protein
MAAMVDPCILHPFRAPAFADALLVCPVRQTRRSAHFLILQLILPRFCAKRYTHRAVFPHLPKCLWKNGTKMAGQYLRSYPFRLLAAFAATFPKGTA